MACYNDACMHGSNGNVFKRHGQGIMIMNKDLGASLKGHLWDVCEGGEAWPEGGRWSIKHYIWSEANDAERIDDRGQYWLVNQRWDVVDCIKSGGHDMIRLFSESEVINTCLWLCPHKNLLEFDVMSPSVTSAHVLLVKPLKRHRWVRRGQYGNVIQPMGSNTMWCCVLNHRLKGCLSHWLTGLLCNSTTVSLLVGS